MPAPSERPRGTPSPQPPALELRRIGVRAPSGLIQEIGTHSVDARHLERLAESSDFLAWLQTHGTRLSRVRVSAPTSQIVVRHQGGWLPIGPVSVLVQPTST